MGGESVKGSLVLGAAVAARRLRDRGRVGAEELERRLSAPARALLDQRIEVARWYPIDAFLELIDLNWHVEGHGRPAYLERQGAASADRLFESNRYQQLEFAERSTKVETQQQLIRQARLIATVTNTFYDFLNVGVELESDGLCICYGNARAFGDPLIHTTVGFMNQINVRQGSKRRWTGSRTRPDEVRFHMQLPKRLTRTAQ